MLDLERELSTAHQAVRISKGRVSDHIAGILEATESVLATLRRAVSADEDLAHVSYQVVHEVQWAVANHGFDTLLTKVGELTAAQARVAAITRSLELLAAAAAAEAGSAS